MRNRKWLTSLAVAPPAGATVRKRAARRGTAILATTAVLAAGAWMLQARAAEPAAITQGGITLKSVAVTLPDSVTEFPGGDAAQVVVQNCTACHSPGMIMTQPVLGEATWRDEVTKMINVYKAPVSAEDVPAIVAYLVAHKGSK